MKILVCGASGMLGKEICKQLEENKIEYIGMYNTNKVDKNNFFPFDLRTLDDFIKEHTPTCIINCIVNRFVDDCETKWNDIKKVNIDIADKLASYNIRIIHISTDYVFDGKTAPYLPYAFPNPLQNYGISKYISELRVTNRTNKYLIIRVPVLYTDTYSNLSESAVTVIGKKIMDLTLSNCSEDHVSIRRPVYIPNFVRFIIDCISNDYYGTYHFYNPHDKYTKYNILCKISDILQRPNNHITPSYEIGNRPIDTQLLDNKYDISAYYSGHNFDNILRKCFDKFYHPSDFKDCFLLIDLDGTLVDSETQHFESYKEITGITRDEFDHNVQMNCFNYDDDIRRLKNANFKNKIAQINLLQNAERFLRFILENDINYAIVTNTSQENVDLYKEYIPILKMMNNWIVKNMYSARKPHQECYELALKMFYKNEKYIVGIENTIAGYQSLKHVTDIIYIYTHNNKELFSQCDVYLFNDYKQIASI